MILVKKIQLKELTFQRVFQIKIYTIFATYFPKLISQKIQAI